MVLRAEADVMLLMTSRRLWCCLMWGLCTCRYAPPRSCPRDASLRDIGKLQVYKNPDVLTPDTRCLHTVLTDEEWELYTEDFRKVTSYMLQFVFCGDIIWHWRKSFFLNCELPNSRYCVSYFSGPSQQRRLRWFWRILIEDDGRLPKQVFWREKGQRLGKPRKN